MRAGNKPRKEREKRRLGRTTVPPPYQNEHNRMSVISLNSRNISRFKEEMMSYPFLEIKNFP